jgi:N-acetylmuramoyl-L-alanine amidase
MRISRKHKCFLQLQSLDSRSANHLAWFKGRGNIFGRRRVFCYKIRMPRQIARLVTIVFFALLAACRTVTTTAVKNTSKTFNTVVVDAGHGGKDSGAYRRYGPPEKMIALDVAQRLNHKLRESQLKTVMTRSSDVFIELNDRVAIENAQKNAIFVSIHFNDSRKRRTRGFETYYHSGASFDLANGIQAKLMTIPNSANGGVHTANFRVLRLATCPAVLVECGYLSNRSEASKTRDSEYRELLADRIAEAIVEQRFGSGVYRASTQVASQSQPQSESTTGGTGLAPGTSRR